MYTGVTEIVNDIISIYDNTETSTLQNVAARRARIVHYLQRTAENVWFHRAWPFSMGSESLTMVAGEDDVPATFGRISSEGGLFDINGVPYFEIAYQDMAYLRDRGIQQQAKLFCVGSKVQIPNVASTAAFTFVYQTVAPTQAYAGTTGFPQAFGQVLLLGTVMKLKEEEGDDRDIWRKDYQVALGQVGTLYVKGSRAQQMPQTIGGMW